ncbi:MAG: hypothetical protein ATN34_00940 [Epulopiscium sp. Nele67-Bin002]|nr:MAG: hypothetical protein BEN18_00880 [Epulopiscium sp. Nuni2H_MBin001]OON91432.1 MAG: hypothetical protein ATN34_00940 [Epulopiscium sp. Nele67-Bin002]OON94545.1 MAG: hypothetical protein ATN33_04295 [Epulopiscium sp. Nele67-Bin001]
MIERAIYFIIQAGLFICMMFFVILDHLGVALITVTIWVIKACYYLLIPYILYKLYTNKIPYEIKLTRKAKQQLRGEIKRYKKKGLVYEKAIELYGKSELGEQIVKNIYK